LKGIGNEAFGNKEDFLLIIINNNRLLALAVRLHFVQESTVLAG
jgi:hypothetical protein